MKRSLSTPFCFFGVSDLKNIEFKLTPEKHLIIVPGSDIINDTKNWQHVLNEFKEPGVVNFSQIAYGVRPQLLLAYLAHSFNIYVWMDDGMKKKGEGDLADYFTESSLGRDLPLPIKRRGFIFEFKCVSEGKLKQGRIEWEIKPKDLFKGGNRKDFYPDYVICVGFNGSEYIYYGAVSRQKALSLLNNKEKVTLKLKDIDILMTDLIKLPDEEKLELVQLTNSNLVTNNIF